MQWRLLEGFKSSKGKYMDATIFLVNNGTLHLHLKKAQCRICAYRNGPCTVKPTSSLQTKLAEAGTKQMSQRSTQRHVSQPFLNKWSNFFSSHRIQGRAACPSFPSQCSTIRQTICCWPAPRCWSYFPSLEVEGFQVLATSQGSHATVGPSKRWEHSAPGSLAHWAVSHYPSQGDSHWPKLSYSYTLWPSQSISSLFGEAVRGRKTQLTERPPQI